MERGLNVLTVSDFVLNPNEFNDIYVDESDDEDEDEDDEADELGRVRKAAGARVPPKEKIESDGFRIVGNSAARNQFVSFLAEIGVG